MEKDVYIKMVRYIAALMLVLAQLLCQCLPVCAESHGRRSILIVLPFDRSLPYCARFLLGFNESLESFDLNGFEIFHEDLDLSTVSEAHLDSLAASYVAKYSSKNFAAIVTFSKTAYDFVLNRCSALSPGAALIPVLPLKEKGRYEHAGRKVVPVMPGTDHISQTIDLILHLQPGLKRLHIVSGTHPFEQHLRERVREVIPKYKNGPEFVFLTEIRYEELLDTVKSFNSKDAVLFVSFGKDRYGSYYFSPFVLRKLSETAGCPVYGCSDHFMDRGIVGGAMQSSYRQGILAGETLLGLFGMKGGVPVPGETSAAPIRQVDERQMVRWHLSESNLPEGYEVVNRSPSLIRDYKGHVVVALLFFFAQSALIFRLLVLGRIRRKTEDELRGTCETLEEKREELNLAIGNLRESEATLKSILASIPVGVLMIDADTGTVRQANRAAAELLGKTPEEMTGSACPDAFEQFIPEEAGGTSQNRANAFEDCLLGAKGEKVNVLKTVDRVSIGGRTHLIGCLLDITRRKAAEREAREKEEQLVHADKMISLGTMAAGIAHEIHNPNNFILLNAPVLKMAWEDVLVRLDEYAEDNGEFLMGEVPYSRVRTHIPVLLGGIIEGAERIRNIVRDMKEFVSRKAFGETEMVDINAVVKASLNLLASKLKKSTGNLVVEYGENIPAVRADAQRLGQVVINLILNGAEALSDKAGLLGVRTYYEPERAAVVMEVRDEGSGIEPENLKRVFDPFFTTKRETGGTGLGLAISQRIIEAYGGRIVIVSKPGEGTTAVLELPARREEK